MVMDLRSAGETYNGPAYNRNLEKSATADAEHYFGWTYTGEGEEAPWEYFQARIDNTQDPDAGKDEPVRYGIAVKRTLLRVFPSPDPLLDDPNDPDFDYQSLSALRVNEPMRLKSCWWCTATRSIPMRPTPPRRRPGGCSPRERPWNW